MRVITESGVATTERTYKPFGETSFETLATPAEDHAFIGERRDPDAALIYLNARYMDPELALFTQPDWFEVTQPGVGTNRYAYSLNDPVNLKDPGGNKTDPQIDIEEQPDRSLLRDIGSFIRSVLGIGKSDETGSRHEGRTGGYVQVATGLDLDDGGLAGTLRMTTSSLTREPLGPPQNYTVWRPRWSLRSLFRGTTAMTRPSSSPAATPVANQFRLRLQTTTPTNLTTGKEVPSEMPGLQAGSQHMLTDPLGQSVIVYASLRQKIIRAIADIFGGGLP